MIKKLSQLEPGDWIEWRGQWVQVEGIEDDYEMRGSAWVSLDNGQNISFPSGYKFRVQDDDDLEDNDYWD